MSWGVRHFFVLNGEWWCPITRRVIDDEGNPRTRVTLHHIHEARLHSGDTSYPGNSYSYPGNESA